MTTPSPSEALLAAVPDLPGVERRPSRVGAKAAPALYVGGREVLHLHGEEEIDLRLTRAEIRRRRAAIEADPRFVLRRPRGDWVEIAVGPDDVAELLQWVYAAIDANRR